MQSSLCLEGLPLDSQTLLKVGKRPFPNSLPFSPQTSLWLWSDLLSTLSLDVQEYCLSVCWSKILRVLMFRLCFLALRVSDTDSSARPTIDFWQFIKWYLGHHYENIIYFIGFDWVWVASNITMSLLADSPCCYTWSKILMAEIKGRAIRLKFKSKLWCQIRFA